MSCKIPGVLHMADCITGILLTCSPIISFSVNPSFDLDFIDNGHKLPVVSGQETHHVCSFLFLCVTVNCSVPSVPEVPISLPAIGCGAVVAKKGNGCRLIVSFLL